jgi:hypothetical protein
MRPLRILLSCLSVLPPTGLLAQQTAAPPAAPRDAVRNGGFERTLQSANLWTGVDKDGFLAGFRGFLTVLNESGNIADTPMPISVATGDLNGDGMVDILAADPLGYVRVYFNSGTKEEPKFTSGELTLPFLASSEGDPPWMPPALGGPETGQWQLRWSKRRQGPRVSLYDPNNTGKLDMVVGNYFGEIILVPNRGSVRSLQFTQPQPFVRSILPTTKDPNRRWGNVFAPLFHDWDGDGRLDLLVGEGSYSANNVHLLPNQGSSVAPVFAEEKRQALALGEGREQLTPALADIDGDTKPELLVTDRRGRITVYRRPAAWKPGDTIPPTGFLAKNGGITPEDAQAYVLGSGIQTISTADLTGDGLFDLVVGKNSGRIAWARNKGTKEQPKFDPPADLTGTKPSPASWLLPSQWDVDTGITRGNLFAFASAVSNEEDPNAQAGEGKRALKFGFAPGANQLIPKPSLVLPAGRLFNRAGTTGGTDQLFRDSSEVRALGGPSNFFVLRQQVQLQIGQLYTLSFQAKGSKVVNATATLGWRGNKQLGEDRLVRGERGAVRRERNQISDSDQASLDFRPAANWSTVTRQFKIEFKKERELNKEKLTSEAILEISFELGTPDGVLYLDDIKLVPAG